jgi:predicted Fe-Mo cluster-binding NifX family protein
MRIAISVESNNGLESPVSLHFGRCPYFILVDVEGQEVKAVAPGRGFLPAIWH